VTAAIEVHGLKKSYGSTNAVDGVDFTISGGEVVGILGPNGAGKSTTIKILTGFLAQTEGDVKILGDSVLVNQAAIQARIGYLPEAAPIYPEMRVVDYLQYVGEVRGLGKAKREIAIEKALNRCGLLERKGQKIGTLSKGLKQRVGLAQAILHEPDILILDEPTSGLDPNQIQQIRQLIREVGETKTVLLSTHILSEVQATCDRVIIMNKGLVVADGPTSEVTKIGNNETLSLIIGAGKVTMNSDAIIKELTKIHGVTQVVDRIGVNLEEGEASLSVRSTEDVRRAVSEWVSEHGLVILEMQRERLDLESVFRELTT
jgi:ABC-2 type transport system ATP-binding protein